MPETDNSILGYFPEAELVIALVYPLGTERTGLEDILKQHLGQVWVRNQSHPPDAGLSRPLQAAGQEVGRARRARPNWRDTKLKRATRSAG